MTEKRLDIDDRLDPARAAALHATLARPGPAPAAGDPLPPFFHHIYFWQVLPPDQLGRDGHVTRGGFIPDFGLPRRMWAGGRLEFHAPLRAGIPARKTTTIESRRQTTGRTGPLAFITLRHEIVQEGVLAVTDLQDVVYRQDPDPGAPAPDPPRAPDAAEVAVEEGFTSTLLFRYSALTFNGHRIHYDESYARGVEGYDGLVVHGPLLSQKLMLLAEDRLGELKRFDYRAKSVVTHAERVSFCAEGNRFWVRGADGRLCLEATAA